MAVSRLSDIASAYPRNPLEEPPREEPPASASNASTTRRAASLQPMEAAAHAAVEHDLLAHLGGFANRGFASVGGADGGADGGARGAPRDGGADVEEHRRVLGARTRARARELRRQFRVGRQEHRRGDQRRDVVSRRRRLGRERVGDELEEPQALGVGGRDVRDDGALVTSPAVDSSSGTYVPPH